MNAQNEETQTRKRGRPAGLSRCGCQGVAYLTQQGLRECCDALVKEGLIGHWWAALHLPEKDEGKKIHFHLRLEPPPSRAVDWKAIVERIQMTVKGEDKPRRFVVDKRGVNDKHLDGLLYARHDSRYLAAKGITRQYKDYDRTAFLTDDEEWLDGQWRDADEFEVEERRLSKAELCELVESDDPPNNRTLLRLVLKNNYSKSDYDLLCQLRTLAMADRQRAKSEGIGEIDE